MSNNDGFLGLTTRRAEEWIEITMADKRKIRILVKKHKSGNPNFQCVIIQCPKDLSIVRVPNENIGNH